MRCVLWLLLLVLPLPALADGWAALERDGAIAIMRHALAPGGGDPAQFVLEDCETQRNLDARGRGQARAIGAELRLRGWAFDHVFPSQWVPFPEPAPLLELGARPRPRPAVPALGAHGAARAR